MVSLSPYSPTHALLSRVAMLHTCLFLLFHIRYWLFAHNRLSKEIVRGVDTSAEGEDNNSVSNASEKMAETEDEDAPFKF